MKIGIEMDIKQFLKLELSGWKKLEIVSLFAIFLLIFINAFFVQDSVISVISAVCGILYTVIAGKGKISCYLFGLMGSGFYSYLSFKSALYGSVCLYMFYYIPMQILGVFQWKRHLSKKTNEIERVQLHKKELFNVVLVSVLLSIVAIVILKYFKDGCCYIDGITTVLSLVGMYLTVKRCIEQWIVWTIVNGLSILMWLDIIFHGEKAYATLIMWSVYFVLGVYFYIQWKREITKNY